MAQVHRPWVAGVCDGSGDVFDVRSPFDGALVGRVAVTTPEQTERAVAAAAAVAPAFAGLPAAARAAALTHVSAQLTRRAAEVADLICAESGKPITWARIEAGRAAVLVSFTGCGPVGWGIRAAVPAKHVTLELGGNAAVLVAPDWSSEADLRIAVERIGQFANYQAGQSCIAVHRVYAAAGVYDRLLNEIVAAVEALRTGNPRDETTEVGPCINADAAERVEGWVQEAVRAGATVLTGGWRDGPSYAPTVLTGVPADARVAREEVFGPVLMVEPVASTAEGLHASTTATTGCRLQAAGSSPATSPRRSRPTGSCRSAG